MTCGSRSTTATWSPDSVSCSIISSPMKPDPMTTAVLGWRFRTQLRIVSASWMLRTVKTPGASTPGMGGTMLRAPVASTSVS